MQRFRAVMRARVDILMLEMVKVKYGMRCEKVRRQQNKRFVMIGCDLADEGVDGIVVRDISDIKVRLRWRVKGGDDGILRVSEVR